MSTTTNANVQTSTPEHWSKETLRHTLVKGFWPRFVGPEGSGSAVIRKMELVNQPGDLIHVQVTSPLAGSGVDGDETTLEGNEENLSTSEITMDTTMHRNAVRTFRRANKRSILDLREEAKFRLSEWGADRLDGLRFSQYLSSSASDVPDATYSPNVYVAGVGTGTKADVDATASKLSVEAIRIIRYRMIDQLASSLMIDGLPRFFLLISPEMEYDLKQDSEYDNYVISAASRGMDNPVFTGAIANIEGVVILPHPSVPTAADGGAGTVAYGQALCFGQEAFIEVLDEDVSWVEKTFDYDNQLGVAYGFASGHRRALEKNSLQVLAAAATPTGA